MWQGKRELADQEREALLNYVTPQEQVQLNIEIERIARLMCEEMHLDPIQVIQVHIEQTRTDLEHWPEAKMFHNPGFGHPSYPVEQESNWIYTERWRTLRRDAARMLAAHRALHRYLLEAE